MDKTSLPTYISIEQAIAHYNLTPEIVQHDLDQGHLKAIQTPQQETLVAEEDVQIIHQRETFWQQVAPLEGQPIGVRDAQKKYNLASTTLNRWVERGIVRVLEESEKYGPGRKKLLNERDVAYLGLVADERGRHPGKSILVPEYLPPHLRCIGG
jgi:hypothetical protein